MSHFRFLGLSVITITSFLFFSACFSNSAYSQHAVGYFVGYGSEKLGKFIDMGSDYEYRVDFYKFQYNYTFHKGRSWSLEAAGTMQFNTSKYITKAVENHFTNGFEFGINAGFAVRKQILKDDLSFYLQLSSGPHYISGAPVRQIAGFIFSNNFEFGADIKVADNIFFSVQTGLRHISNAETRHPNRGINTLNINGGLTFNLSSYQKRAKGN